MIDKKNDKCESVGPLIAIKKDVSSKWKPMRSELRFRCLSKGTIGKIGYPSSFGMCKARKMGHWEKVWECWSNQCGNSNKFFEKVQDLVSCRWYQHGVKNFFNWSFI